jgi:hypothetical protein
MVKIFNPNAYDLEVENGVGANSLSITSKDFIKKTTGVVAKATAWDTIVWLSATLKTFASDNQTVALDTVSYNPFNDNTKYELPVSGITLTFAWDLVTSNVVNLKVNWVAMTAETFDTSNAQTLTNIAAQLVTDFPTVIAAATTGTNLIKITPVTTNGSVVITDIVVTAGASQTTWTVANDTISYTDEGKFYDITTGGQSLAYHTANASSGQVKLYRAIEEWTFAVVKIANT